MLSPSSSCLPTQNATQYLLASHVQTLQIYQLRDRDLYTSLSCFWHEEDHLQTLFQPENNCWFHGKMISSIITILFSPVNHEYIWKWMSILCFGWAILGKHFEKFTPTHFYLLFCIVECLWETNFTVEMVANMVEQFYWWSVETTHQFRP